jgi:hypothetical protein
LDNVARGTSLRSQPQNSLVNVSNPLDSSAPHLHPGSQPTRTLNAREVYHEAQEALKPLLNGVITQEDLDDLKEELSELRYVFFLLNSLSCSHQHTRRARAEEQSSGQIFDPPSIRQKGRPRTARITGAIEGRSRGGGPSRTLAPMTPAVPALSQQLPTQTPRSRQPLMSQRSTRKCGLCRQAGHTRATCDWVQ